MRARGLTCVAAGWLVATAAAAQSAIGAPVPAPDLRAVAFAARSPDKPSGVFDQQTVVAGPRLATWTAQAVRLPGRGAAVDTVRLGVGGVLRPTGSAVVDPARAQFESRAYEVSVIRDWPAALRMDAGAFDLDLTPHAGVGMTSYGGLAEAGAMVRVTPSRDDRAVQRLRDIGVGDGAGFGDRGRWYLYVAASGRAVGLNVLRGESGWNRAGWTTDPSSTLISDAQLGLGWRRGSVQSSLGYVHREVKGDHMMFGQETRRDSLIAFTLSVKRGR